MVPFLNVHPRLYCTEFTKADQCVFPPDSTPAVLGHTAIPGE